MAKGAWTGFSVTAILMVQLIRNVPGEASGRCLTGPKCKTVRTRTYELCGDTLMASKNHGAKMLRCKCSKHFFRHLASLDSLSCARDIQDIAQRQGVQAPLPFEPKSSVHSAHIPPLRKRPFFHQINAKSRYTFASERDAADGERVTPAGPARWQRAFARC